METPQTIRPGTEHSLELRLKALRERLYAVFHELLSDAVELEILEHIDWCLLEWRWVESHVAKQAAQMDRRAQAVILQVATQSSSRERRLLKWRWFGSARPSGRLSDAQVSAVLNEVILQSHELLLLLHGYRDFLQEQLAEQEAELARQFARLHGIAVGAGDAVEKVARRIEMLQDLVDGTIGMISSVSLLYNKILVDAEASILAATSLNGDLATYKVPQLELLLTQFQRAERGLLSVQGIAHRKAVLDDAFQRKLSTTRQVTS